jgi:hypothetical protein
VAAAKIGKRDLRDSRGPLEFPDWYVRDYGWVAKTLDWRGVFSEGVRIAEADHHRMMHYASGSSEPLPEHAKTGYAFLDMRTTPSVAGRSLRKLAHRFSTRELPPWEVGRAKQQLDRVAATSHHKIDRRALKEVLLEAQSMPSSMQEVADFFESRDHRTRLRRVSEATQSFLGGRLVAPATSSLSTVQNLFGLANGQFSNLQGFLNPINILVNPSLFEGTLRYLLWGEVAFWNRRGRAMTVVCARRHSLVLPLPRGHRHVRHPVREQRRRRDAGRHARHHALLAENVLPFW